MPSSAGDDFRWAGGVPSRGRPGGDGGRMSGTAHLVRLVAGARGRAVVASLSLALLVGTGYGWTVQRTLTDRVVTSDVIGSRTVAPEPEQPFTALLVGLDSRTDAAGNPLPPE